MLFRSDTNFNIQSWSGTPYLNIVRNNINALYLSIASSGDAVFSNGGPTERMRIAANGYVGIGTSSPTNKLSVNGYMNDNAIAGNGQGLGVARGDGNAFDIYIGTPTSGTGSSNGLAFESNYFRWLNLTNTTEWMRVDSSGNVGIGTSNPSGTPTSGFAFQPLSGASSAIFGHATGTVNGTWYNAFAYNGSVIGAIVQNSTSSVSYNTTSDHRLKENVAPMTMGLATISQLKPVTYDWISDKSKGEGFIAHELQAVIPHAVTGEKDAVDENGKIKPQGVDYSKVVVHLVAAIQELSAKLAALEAKVGA